MLSSHAADHHRVCAKSVYVKITNVRAVAAQLIERGVLTPRVSAWHPTSAARRCRDYKLTVLRQLGNPEPAPGPLLPRVRQDMPLARGFKIVE
jgi:hypothetical protein